MSLLASAALQKALYVRLAADAELAERVEGIFDTPPKPMRFPFVLIGAAGASDWSTKTFRGQRHVVTLQVFSRDSGEFTLKELADIVSTALQSAPVTVEGHNVVGPFFDSLQTLIDADGVRQARLRFVVLTEAVSDS